MRLCQVSKRIDPYYCPILRRSKWEDFRAMMAARNELAWNYPSMPHPIDEKELNKEWLLRTINVVLRTYKAMPYFEC